MTDAVRTHSALPLLDGDALAAVEHRGSHMQIIAAAGAGKTEVVSQRVADLLATGVPARGVVAFYSHDRRQPVSGNFDAKPAAPVDSDTVSSAKPGFRPPTRTLSVRPMP